MLDKVELAYHMIDSFLDESIENIDEAYSKAIKSAITCANFCGAAIAEPLGGCSCNDSGYTKEILDNYDRNSKVIDVLKSVKIPSEKAKEMKSMYGKKASQFINDLIRESQPVFEPKLKYYLHIKKILQ